MISEKKYLLAGFLAAGMTAGLLNVTEAAPASANAEQSYVVLLQATETDTATGATQKPADKKASQPDQAEKKDVTTTVGSPWEVQIEYLDARFYKKRNIDLYNFHLFHQFREVKHLKLSYGLTLERALGYTMEHDYYHNSDAVGFGPAFQVRWERPISGKLTGSLGGTGSLLFYNHNHPGGGRSYGFLWRIGPRLSYHYTDRDAISLAYLFHHSSNGMRTHNPGYNGVGFSLGYTHSF